MKNVMGRSCPTAYRYSAESVGDSHCIDTEVLYVVGGLYGNEQALDSLELLAAQETRPVTLCFNGDFNWFNIVPDSFQAINERVLKHTVIRGNVETELGVNSVDADCGCGYPEFVDDIVVARSNQIIRTLKNTAGQFPQITDRLSRLSMYLRFRVAGVQLAVVHGDPESLSGWGLAQEVIDQPGSSERVTRWCERMGSSLIACTHTCLPYLYQSRSGFQVINNGAAGMPNFRGDLRGVVTRIAASTKPANLTSLYGTKLGHCHIDAVPLDYDHFAWLDSFDSQWSAESPAALSYRTRILGDIDYGVERALRGDLAGPVGKKVNSGD